MSQVKRLDKISGLIESHQVTGKTNQPILPQINHGAKINQVLANKLDWEGANEENHYYPAIAQPITQYGWLPSTNIPNISATITGN
jgi:hypothetical protein